MIKPYDWSDPRSAIAQIYKDNDYGYVMHATMLFMEFCFASGLGPCDLKGKKILDYGCGTGRVSRVLALTGAKVVGYDPTPECIEEGSIIESKKSIPTTLVPTLTLDFSTVDRDFDIAVCINVLTHLNRKDYDLAVGDIVAALKEGGACYLWVHKHTHLPLKNQELIKQQATNTVIVRGLKKNGKIEHYENTLL